MRQLLNTRLLKFFSFDFKKLLINTLHSQDIEPVNIVKVQSYFVATTFLWFYFSFLIIAFWWRSNVTWVDWNEVVFRMENSSRFVFGLGDALKNRDWISPGSWTLIKNFKFNDCLTLIMRNFLWKLHNFVFFYNWASEDEPPICFQELVYEFFLIQNEKTQKMLIKIVQLPPKNFLLIAKTSSSIKNF